MTAIVVQRLKEPVFVVSEQTDNLRVDRASEPENRIHATFGVRTSVDVVAQEYDRLTPPAVAVNLLENVVERLQITVNVTDCNRSHASSVSGRLLPNAPESTAG